VIGPRDTLIARGIGRPTVVIRDCWVRVRAAMRGTSFRVAPLLLPEATISGPTAVWVVWLGCRCPE